VPIGEAIILELDSKIPLILAYKEPIECLLLLGNTLQLIHFLLKSQSSLMLELVEYIIDPTV
jgi:hypothetical protein